MVKIFKMAPKNLERRTRSSGANVRRIGQHRPRSVSPTSSTASTVVPDLAEEEVNEGVIFVAPGTRKIKRRQSLSPDITSFREIKSNPGLLRNKPTSSQLPKVDTKSQQSKLSQHSGPTDGNMNGTRSSEANVRRIGQHRSRSVSATSSTAAASPVPQDVEEREVNEGVTLVAPGTRKIKRRQSLSPDITSFQETKLNPPLLRNKPTSSHLRKVDTKSQQSKLSQPSGPTDGNKNGTRSSEANVRRIGQHRSRSVSPTSSTASTVVSDVEENEVNELVTQVAPSPPLLRIKQCSVLLTRIDRPCEENSETVQEVEKIALLRAGQAEVTSVSPKENLHTDTKKFELYNDNKSVQDVATDDPITPRNEEEETKKADAIAGSSLNLGPNIASSPLLPSSDSFCSLGVELPSMDATREWVVRQNRYNEEASSSKPAGAPLQTQTCQTFDDYLDQMMVVKDLFAIVQTDSAGDSTNSNEAESLDAEKVGSKMNSSFSFSHFSYTSKKNESTSELDKFGLPHDNSSTDSDTKEIIKDFEQNRIKKSAKRRIECDEEEDGSNLEDTANPKVDNEEGSELLDWGDFDEDEDYYIFEDNMENNGEALASTQAAAETALASSSSSVALITKAVENVTRSAKKSSSKVVDTPRKRLPVPTVKIVDTKSVFMRDNKNINVDADPKLRTEVLKCDSDVPWICSFCHLGPHVQVRVLNNHGHVSPYAMGDLFGPYFANLPSIYGKPSPKRETWMHGDCAVWAGRLLLVKTSLKYLEETLSSADKEVCSICGKNGATIGCFRRKCKLAVHFPCAKSKGWKLDGATFLGYCPEHR
ncbi:unnamed protein product [Orchesella dallaii]|uniref:PHD-type domain-containing protein n=1 Tax=Orchesella dallaii TaxID=48710 RepID=A0ABP1Q0C0_9HEXA